MSTDSPLPPDPEEAVAPVPLGPPPGVLPDDLLPEVIPVRRRDHPVVAWTIILLIIGLSVVGNALDLRETKAGPAAPRTGRPAALHDLEQRYLVGANELLKGTGKDIFPEIADMERGPPEQRLRFAVLAGEMRGPARALQVLNALEPPGEENDLARLRDILVRLYAEYENQDFTQSSLSLDDEVFLRKQLGWLAELALHPPGTPDQAGRAAVLAAAQRTTLSLVALVGALLLGGLAGLLSLMFVLLQVRRGALSSAIQPPIVNGNLYVETVALWFLAFVAFSIAALLLPVPKEIRLLALGLPQVLALGVLAWPVLRGVPWKQVRDEIGLTTGKGVLPELLAGIRCYLMALPLLTIGALVVLLLLKLRGSGGPIKEPSHPVTDLLGEPSWMTTVQAFVVLSLIAPVVEEVVFRGLLYRHLREATWHLRTGVSIFLSATLVSFLFAAIHPQGPLFVPVLMALAYAFTLAREWRGSLLPAMVAHGINNGVVLLLFTLTFD